MKPIKQISNVGDEMTLRPYHAYYTDDFFCLASLLKIPLDHRAEGNAFKCSDRR